MRRSGRGAGRAARRPSRQERADDPRSGSRDRSAAGIPRPRGKEHFQRDNLCEGPVDRSGTGGGARDAVPQGLDAAEGAESCRRARDPEAETSRPPHPHTKPDPVRAHRQGASPVHRRARASGSRDRRQEIIPASRHRGRTAWPAGRRRSSLPCRRGREPARRSGGGD